ncbi:hypothetical protein G6F46_003648 [Rhizopus delemar]|uniref:NodB homology domain-containing protein n=3 Tax=Rhizopus TaxID=4842 RepID=I1CEU3_RHIO9|nr:hypothetical protein RO3G_11684 [Rhizopus delemar RA 99-880]KAG1056781.1 hypothetical protein G6F43_001350 [Rhizopus delemar]KAG1548154.1 hypothetical protein G6F51_003838 [Rhizopus arrhizus]KAG1464861.1 hypothetical protein G6F55_001503 [Rhizopus delemar]KAG1503084.1 hypothetical protein G6F54_001919 [Rhizopus delemar]|eukprot:EIE86973.1 hypothetical protein RO3G_11684 [Rhizopus delemar RA 99-880]
MVWLYHSIALSSAVAIFVANAQLNTTSTSSSPPAQTSPSYLSNIVPLSGNVQSYPASNTSIPTGALPSLSFNASGYPEVWKSPPTDSAEVKEAIASINWGLVPNATIRKANSNGDLSMTGYDSTKDPDCWWSASGCVQSKNPVIPPDYYRCPNVGEWGLTYDDGPLTSEAGTWAEPNLYDFLAQHNQKAGLFYIGSNVVQAPAAAQRALADGHTLCVHTWSHPAMTSLSNEAVVAELYWTLRAIKEVTGVTTKCWRPPYGDVDDRVRAIAWQMGLATVIWDEDTDDWNMPGDGGGNLSPSTVDGYFENWIAARKNGSDSSTGHIILQHELNNATVSMAEKWLPEIQQVFNVMPWNQCFNISQPYWEKNFVYPTLNGSTPSTNTTVSQNVTVTASIGSAAAVQSSPPSSASVSSSNRNSTTSSGIRLSSSGFVSCLIGMIVIAYAI